MKIKEFAESQGITTQAVYQRLKNFTRKKNTSLSDYVSADTGEITEDGYSVLQSLYKQPVKSRSTKKQTDNRDESTYVNVNEALIKSLNERISDKDKEIARLSEALAHERETVRLLVETLQTATKPTGFFRRLFPGKQDPKQKTDTK